MTEVSAAVTVTSFPALTLLQSMIAEAELVVSLYATLAARLNENPLELWPPEITDTPIPIATDVIVASDLAFTSTAPEEAIFEPWISARAALLLVSIAIAAPTVIAARVMELSVIATAPAIETIELLSVA